MWKLYVNSDKAAVSDSRYKKDAFDKMQANKFNVADSEQYKKNEELRKHQSDVQYKVWELLINFSLFPIQAQFEKERNNFTTLAVTMEMEQAKQLQDLKVRVIRVYFYYARYFHITQNISFAV